MTPKIEKLCSKAIADVEAIAEHETVNGEHTVKYDIIELTVRMFSSVILECFFGGATEETIEGTPACVFINKLIADLVQAGFELVPSILGVKFLNMGIRAKDRDVNRRIVLFKSWGLKYIKSKIAEVRERIK